MASRKSQTPQVSQGSWATGAQLSRLTPAARAMKAAARRIASASTPERAMLTRRRIRRSSCSGARKLCRQPWLQK
ncbi:hypothetical protein [Cyanobium sp. FACHB-13342]|uniref:hypothetical protein n=1 Tax=Cyanobium sp. FACHB-13342 TaxID=2692793 RepID=UPI001F558A4E|nr:hypothetical protein [Cyanobium sp. FACHB-13342]